MEKVRGCRVRQETKYLDALLISEVKMLLEFRKAQHESQDDEELSEVRLLNAAVITFILSLTCAGVHKDAGLLPHQE